MREYSIFNSKSCWKPILYDNDDIVWLPFCYININFCILNGQMKMQIYIEFQIR